MKSRVWVPSPYSTGDSPEAMSSANCARSRWRTRLCVLRHRRSPDTPKKSASRSSTCRSGLRSIRHSAQRRRRIEERDYSCVIVNSPIHWPGAAHLYRRQWARGCSWAALYGAALVFPSSGAPLVNGNVAEPLLVTAPT